MTRMNRQTISIVTRTRSCGSQNFNSAQQSNKVVNRSTLNLANKEATVKLETIEDPCTSKATEKESLEPMQNVKSDEVSSGATVKREPAPSPAVAMMFPLTPEQARVTAFPPGCNVLHVNDECSPPTVTIGKVESVSFDVASKELLYALVPNNDPISSNSQSSVLVASETQLVFAPLCTVEATLNGVLGPTTKPAIVLTSYQPRPLSEPLYSLQEEDSGALLHGLPKACVKYRPVESVEQIEEEVANEQTEAVVNASRNDEPEEQQTTQETFVDAEVPNNESPMPPVEPNESTDLPPPPPPPHQEVSPSPVVRHRRIGRRPAAPGCGIKRPSQSSPPADAKPESQDTHMGRIPKRTKLNAHANDAADDAGMQTRSEGAKEDETTPHALKSAHASKPSDTDGKYNHSGLEEGEEHEEIAEKVFNIPGNVFSVSESKEHFRSNTHKLMQDTSCILRLKSREGRYGEELYINVKGPRKLVDSAISAIETSLLSLVHPFEQGRALYYMALLNDHRYVTERNGCEIVYQYCYHHNKYGEKIPQYILYRRFPDGFRPAFGMAIGSRGRFKNEIAKNTNCTIETNADSSSPHYIIYGHDVENVARCGQQFQKSIDDAIAFKKREKKQLRRYSK